MFTIKRTQFGVTYPIPVIYVNDTEWDEEDVTLRADVDTDSLRMSVIEADVTFVEDVTLTEYPFPLSGTDFITARTGTLHIEITETLTEGLHLANFESATDLQGLFGLGITGLIQGGNVTAYHDILSTIVQVQQFTFNGTGITLAEDAGDLPQPFPVRILPRG